MIWIVPLVRVVLNLSVYQNRVLLAYVSKGHVEVIKTIGKVCHHGVWCFHAKSHLLHGVLPVCMVSNYDLNVECIRILCVQIGVI